MTEIPVRKKMITNFGGIDEREVIQENAFADMQNMSSDMFPAIGPRGGRGKVIRKLKKPNGLIFNNGLAWVDGTDFYFDETKVGTVTDGKKQMVSMGAYILIWPDKKAFNTNNKEWKDIEKTWTQGAQASIGPTTDASTFIKISCPGIGEAFGQGDGVEISGCSNASLNKSAVIQSLEKDHIVVIADVTKSFTQDSGLTVKRKAPDMDYLTELDNRVWGCSSAAHEVYACKLGDPFNWNCFEGISTDSYAATIGSDGDFTGAITHLGYVLFFKEDVLHKVYGSRPNNIQINTYPVRGVMEGCEHSLAVVNETLLYMSREGVCAYDGGMPYLVSQEIRKGHTGARGGPYQGKYYISIDWGSRTGLYVFDLEKGLWHREDDTALTFPCPGAGNLYYVDAERQIRPAAGGEEQISWYLESGDLLEDSLDKKRLHRLQFMMELDRGTMVEIWLRYDADPAWRRVKTLSAVNKQSYMMSVRPRRCSRYRYRITGKGRAKLYGLSKTYTLGSGR